jgi:hypothetical protein
MHRNVVIAGWGQVTQGKEQKGCIFDPIGLMAASSIKSAEMTGSKEVLKNLDAIMVGFWPQHWVQAIFRNRISTTNGFRFHCF